MQHHMFITEFLICVGFYFIVATYISLYTTLSLMKFISFNIQLIKVALLGLVIRIALDKQRNIPMGYARIFYRRQ